MLDDRFEQRPEIDPHAFLFFRGRAGLRVRVQHRKVELFFGRVEIDEQVVDLVQHFLRPGVRAIDLVDDDDRREPALERLAQHEPGLRQRTFGRVDQQHHAVDHRQRPLHLAAKIGVAGRIDDVDQDVVVVNGGVFRKDGDPALPLEFVAVHGAFRDAFVGAERPALVEQGIDEGGLAVVDVGDDGDVTSGRIRDEHPLSIPVGQGGGGGWGLKLEVGGWRLEVGGDKSELWRIQAIENLARAGVERLIADQLFRKAARVVFSREIEVRGGGVEPRRRPHACIAGYLGFASRHPPIAPRLGHVGSAEPRDLAVEPSQLTVETGGALGAAVAAAFQSRCSDTTAWK